MGTDTKENVVTVEHGVDVNPLLSRVKRARKSKCCGKIDLLTLDFNVSCYLRTSNCFDAFGLQKAKIAN